MCFCINIHYILNHHTAKYFANARRDAHINVSGIKKAGIKCSLLKFLVISRSAFYCGANVPDETGKMSRSDKRGATLPKVVATSVAKLTDEFPEGRFTAENIYATEMVTVTEV